MTCPPQPYGTQFHTAHSSPVQLVSPPLSHVGGREYKSPLLEIKDFGPPARGGHFFENELKRNELFTSHQVHTHFCKD